MESKGSVVQKETVGWQKKKKKFFISITGSKKIHTAQSFRIMLLSDPVIYTHSRGLHSIARIHSQGQIKSRESNIGQRCQVSFCCSLYE